MSTGKTIRLDSKRRAITVGRNTTVLQEKNWQVLRLLMRRAPALVSRQELIDTVWSGNSLTGEKGVNQALWVIRASLGDEAREPEFIRTIPRVGYQWIHSLHPGGAEHWASARRLFATAAGLATLFMVANSASYLAESDEVRSSELNASPVVATSAYLWNNDIVVELESGCRGILKNASNKNIGEPVLSSDGSQVAFTMQEGESCRLVTVDVADGKRSDFGACPSDVI